MSGHWQVSGRRHDATGSGAGGRALSMAIVAAVVVAAYARTVGDGLYLDDHHHVRPWTVSEVLGTFHGPFDPLGLEPVYFRPLTVVSFALDWGAWGWNPAGFHVTNVALHAVACVGVLLLLRRLGVGTAIALAGAALFALIPANVAAAVYISERSDIMVAIFTIAGLLALGRYATDRRSVWLVLLNVAYVLAIGSKEVGISAILSAALFWWYLQLEDRGPAGEGVVAHWRNELRLIARPLTDRSRRMDWVRVLGPMLIIAAGTVVYRALVLPSALSERYSGTNPVASLISAVGHAFQMVPWELPALASPVLAVVTVAAFAGAPRSGGWRLALLGVAWVVATCVPLAWLGQVEPRLLYVAEIGVVIFVAGVATAVVDATRRLSTSARRLAVGAVTLATLAFFALTVRGTVDAQDQFVPGSPKMLSGDLKIWTDTPQRLEAWPAYWMPAIRERLLGAGLIQEDGSVTDAPDDH